MLVKLLILLNICSTCFGVKYNCAVSGETCTITEINENKNDYKIEPVTENSSDITKLILYGNFTVLAGGFCEVLPNLKYFEADDEDAPIEVIKKSAFQGCEKLEIIRLWDNKLKRIDRKSFKGLRTLKKLGLGGGNIPIFNVNLSDLKDLKELSLFSINLTEFPARVLREQKKLEDLYLYTNNLFDLDVEGILTYAPNLKRIDLDDNNFKCSRLREIITLLKTKNIKIGEPSIYPAERDYKTEKIDGIDCLTDEKWNELYTKYTNYDPFSFLVESD